MSAADRGSAEGSAEQLSAACEHVVTLLQNVRWMIGLRWLAVLGVCAALLLAWWTGWSQHLLPPALVVAGLASFNLLCWLRVRSPRSRQGFAGRLEAVLVLQLVVDLLLLALLVRLTGGIHNPFVLFSIFPVALAAMLLPTRSAVLVGGWAFALVGGLVACDISSTSPHMPFGLLEPADPGPMGHPPYVAAVLAAAAMTLFGVIYFIHAVTQQRHRADEERRRHRRVAQARERLARVGKLSAGVAHSVRNPLHGVLNCLDLLRDQPDPEQRAELIELATEGLKRIETVSSRLLAMTRATAMDRKLVDFNAQVRETLRLFEVRLPQHGIELKTQFGRLPPVQLDPLRLHEAMFNVLDNALDAVRTVDERWIQVSTRCVSEPCNCAQVEIEDSGTGVDEGIVGDVFDPFVTSKSADEGTGLGLAITREIVEEHGGVIQFSSKPGVGTVVRLLLPLGGSSGDSAGSVE